MKKAFLALSALCLFAMSGCYVMGVEVKRDPRARARREALEREKAKRAAEALEKEAAGR